MSAEQQLREEDAKLEDQEARLQTDTHRAHQANSILQHPLVKEAFEALEQGAFERWKNTRTEDESMREKLWLQYQACQQFRRYFVKTMEQGKVANSYLKEIGIRRGWLKKQLDHFR